jgi:hypothetical protein
MSHHWLPTVGDMELGFQLVPIVLGLRAAERSPHLTEGTVVDPGDWSSAHPDLALRAIQVLREASWLGIDEEGRPSVTPLGARGFARGPGPFGIIEAYHPYLAQGRELLLAETDQIWVRRGENIAASQDANRRTFERGNDALDRFCADLNFEYRVFIEHAIGRGEATRQRFERSGEDSIRYFGADLEDAAIDAAEREQEAGRLPENMCFVREADIGRPQVLLTALASGGVEAFASIMMVGNGFHEVRDQTDEAMTNVFREYEAAGVILIFTEETALSVDDLRATAWNTYHAGFRYVHEKSGQGLRPADPAPRSRLGEPLPASWSDCAQRAGYRRADAYCHRTRTIYPHPTETGYNPSISVTHFFVPDEIADQLGLSLSSS